MDEANLTELLGAQDPEEAAHFVELATQLAFAAPAATPSPALKARLMAALLSPATAGRKDVPQQELPGVFVLRQQQQSWRPTPFAGVTYNHLYLNEQTKLQTVILRLEPGAHYPRHRHREVEQCLVLSGDVFTAGRRALVAGDFEWAEAGTEHDSITSTNGCELLLIASVHNEMVHNELLP